MKNSKVYKICILFLFVFLFINSKESVRAVSIDKDLMDYIEIAATIEYSNSTIVPDKVVSIDNISTIMEKPKTEKEIQNEIIENVEDKIDGLDISKEEKEDLKEKVKDINIDDANENIESSKVDMPDDEERQKLVEEFYKQQEELIRQREEEAKRQEANSRLLFQSASGDNHTNVETYVQNGDWNGIAKDVPEVNNFKCFESYTLFGQKTKQFRLQQAAYDGDFGIRVVDGRYCVALGSYYSVSIGQYFDVVMENGSVIPCILADGKADKDCDPTHRQSLNGSVVEFIVNQTILDATSKRMGDLSYACDEFKGNIKEIILYDRNFF